MNDIHFSKSIKDSKLKYIVNYIKYEKPNYILIPGDIIDCLNELDNINVKSKLINWLNDISKNTIVLISLGNHDMFRKANGIRYFELNEDLINDINNIDNVYLLNNQVYEDDIIYVCGITQTYKYYCDEDINILISDLDKNIKLLNINNEKLKILLIHSPGNFDKQVIQEKTINFDYIVCGHTHNGCVPPLLNEIWKGTRGIITPNKKWFKKNERNTLINKNDKLLVNGPITTFQNISGFFKMFNFLFPIYISIMNFNNKNNFKITKKYHKYK